MDSFAVKCKRCRENSYRPASEGVYPDCQGWRAATLAPTVPMDYDRVHDPHGLPLAEGRMMAEPEHNPIRDEPVKPPMLNPVVRHVLPSGDLKWILIAVVLAAAVGIFALLFGTWH